MTPKTANAEFYVNPFAGMTIFDSTVTIGGTKLIDQGGDAINFGIRAGWLSSGPYFFGGEIEGNAFSGRSRAIVNGQIYNYALEWGAEAYAYLDQRDTFFNLRHHRKLSCTVERVRDWQNATTPRT